MLPQQSPALVEAFYVLISYPDSIQKVGVSRIVVITDGPFSYNGESLNNDIALIELSQPLSFDASVQPACLPTSGLCQKLSLVQVPPNRS